MTEQELRIAKISSLLNSAIREKNSKDYKKALQMLEKCNPKPSLQQLLDAQAKESKHHFESQSKKKDEEPEVRSKKPKNDDEGSVNVDDMSLNQLEEELENLRKQDPEPGSYEKSKEEIEAEEEKRIQEVIKRYEKTFGRIKDLGSYRSNTGSVTGKSIVSSHPSKGSKASEFSTASQREAIEKLKKLDEEEEKIRKEKEELMKFLEMRSSCKSSSRPVTVSSMLSRQEIIDKEQKPELPRRQEKAPEKPLEKIVEEKKKTVKSVKPKDELQELFSNL
ncbi:hypothetical protein SteCoe_15724 [Stentor coeruleus]|uniref:Uncharacterized protein n=1 Tax=Stentor coeruleus TaxID=5963 RepID=A0A1R2C353_9CILI|nr:hypothetical protein SteCoe_15724 [Stentor coeruleus]